MVNAGSDYSALADSQHFPISPIAARKFTNRRIALGLLLRRISVGSGASRAN